MMKKIFTLSLILVFTGVLLTAQENSAKIKFDKTEHDFGKGPVGKPATYNFKFYNTGSEPLVLSNVKASCGCTAPSWPKEPIMPGESGEIKVQYNMARAGTYRKSITVTTVGGETVVLYVSGDAISNEGAQGVDGPKPSIISNPKAD